MSSGGGAPSGWTLSGLEEAVEPELRVEALALAHFIAIDPARDNGGVPLLEALEHVAHDELLGAELIENMPSAFWPTSDCAIALAASGQTTAISRT